MHISTLNSITSNANGVIRFAFGESSVGSILVAKSGQGVCAILLGDDRLDLAKELRRRFPQSTLVEGPEDLQDHVAEVIAFVDTPAKDLDLPLDLRGTAFQRRVWQALRDIPTGKTASYTEVAELIGLPKSARAVAQACAANPIALAVPCHRVVRNDGALSGYRWGVERKRVLLEREAAA
jgi:AraC family transcriptional regulator of adaptative response/methylated-DNA-[protein]-cysteine methyltransferase